jgi:hypothetical protein
LFLIILLFDHIKLIQNQFVADKEFIIVFFLVVYHPLIMEMGNAEITFCCLPRSWYPLVPRVLSRGKIVGRGVHHLPVFSSKVKKHWSYTSAPPCALHGTGSFLRHVRKIAESNY